MVGEVDQHQKVRTEVVNVRIFTQDFEIEGEAHAKPGGYSGRISDILNLSKISFLPVTQARYRERSDQLNDFVETDCIMVRLETIEILEFF